jgi:hypothetical protein
MTTTSLTSVASDAGSPEPIRGPSPAPGHEAEILDVSYEFGLSIVHRSVLIGGMYDRPLRRVADAQRPSC